MLTASLVLRGGTFKYCQEMIYKWMIGLDYSLLITRMVPILFSEFGFWCQRFVVTIKF